MSAPPNWFVGLPLPAATGLGTLPALPSGLEDVAAGDRHMTVAFLGPCGEAAALQAWAARARWTRGPVAGIFGPVAPFGPRHRYSALAVEIEGPAPTAIVTALQTPMLDAAGRPPEGRRPRPHVTVSRPTRHATEAERSAGLAWAATVPAGEAVTFDRIALYTWAPRGGTTRFRVVAAAHLSPSGP